MYKINDNTSAIINEHKGKTSVAIRFMLDAVQNESYPNTPKKAGLLGKDVIKRIISDNSGYIRWARQYAAAQEAGQMTVRKRRVFKTSEGNWVTLKPGVYRFKNYTTPGTGAHFAENAVRNVGANHIKYFKMAGLL